MNYEVAPLEGVTTFAFRRLHQAMFGGADGYYTPFFVPTQERKLSTKEARDLDPDHNQGVSVIPQVLTKKVDDVLWATQQVEALGYTSLNLNLGCPAGTIVSKGKGSGLLADVATLDAFLDGVFSQVSLPISVKTRLGIQSPQEFPALLDVFNRYPITRLTIHPRVQKDYYKLPVRPDSFAYALSESRIPLTYNGDLCTLDDFQTLTARFPQVDTVMVGRGLIADPALFRKAHGGAPATREELQAFTAALYQTYQQAYGHQGTAAHRMKELWFYLINLFEDHQRLDKKMRRLSKHYEYEAIEQAIFQELALSTQNQNSPR